MHVPTYLLALHDFPFSFNSPKKETIIFGILWIVAVMQQTRQCSAVKESNHPNNNSITGNMNTV